GASSMPRWPAKRWWCRRRRRPPRWSTSWRHFVAVSRACAPARRSPRRPRSSPPPQPPPRRRASARRRNPFTIAAVDIPSLLPFLALAEPVASAGGAGVVVHDLWSVQSLISFATLAALEIVLGIDNV